MMDELLAKGWVEPQANSPHNNPIFLVQKPGGKGWRVVLDFRRLNSITTKDNATRHQNSTGCRRATAQWRKNRGGQAARQAARQGRRGTVLEVPANVGHRLVSTDCQPRTYESRKRRAVWRAMKAKRAAAKKQCSRVVAQRQAEEEEAMQKRRGVVEQVVEQPFASSAPRGRQG